MVQDCLSIKKQNIDNDNIEQFPIFSLKVLVNIAQYILKCANTNRCEEFVGQMSIFRQNVSRQVVILQQRGHREFFLVISEFCKIYGKYTVSSCVRAKHEMLCLGTGAIRAETVLKASFGSTPTAILFGYTRNIPRDLGNVG